MTAADVERVARALCRQHGLQFMTDEGIDGYVQMYWHDHVDDARVAMRETREIDAEALQVEAQKARDNLYVEASDELRGVANWLKGRADDA